MTTPSLRERKKERTSSLIVEVAVDLFAEHGFDAVTVEQIAREAEVSPRTVFRYFPSKEAILFPNHHELLELLAAALSGRPASEPPLIALGHALRALVDHYMENKEQHLQRAHLAMTGAAVAAYQRAVLQPQWEDALAEALAERMGVSAEADMRPRLLASIALAILNAVSRAWIASEMAGDLHALLEEAFAGVLDAAQVVLAPSDPTVDLRI